MKEGEAVKDSMQSMQERIGNVTLDYQFYPGEDLYSDGEIEDTMLTIVKEHSKEEYQRIVEQSGSWPILYHLSELRGNIIEWLPMNESTKVLEIGSGCGAITSTLSQKAGKITCVDLSKKRSLINAYRNKDQNPITIHVGNFQDIEPRLPCDYDYVLLVGVFEYGQGYIGGEHPYEEFMRILNRHCKKDGHLIIAIENKLGLKYWAGCREDHAGTYFESLENYPKKGGARTFTRRGLEEILKKVGIEQYHFYYPYPDYKFMHTIYSDERLPNVGELSTNIRNFDRERMLLFDETAVFNTVLEEKEFPLFSNSYMVITGKRPEIVYSKYSNERSIAYVIRTDILKEDVTNNVFVRKTALSDKASVHLKGIWEIAGKLENKYEGSGLHINRCEMEEDGDLRFDFEKGVTLESLLDQAIEKNDKEEYRALIRKYYDFLSYHSEEPYSDYDFIFQNILVNENTWTLIDYEWTYEEVIPYKEIAYRAFYCFSLGSKERALFEKDWYFELFQITKDEEDAFMEREKQYQRTILGDRLALGEIRDRIGNPVISPLEGEKVRVGGEDLKYRVQIYPDFGNGFSEECSFFLKRSYVSEHGMEFEFTLDRDAKAVRIDPCMFAGIVTMKECTLDGRAMKINPKLVNGKRIGERSYLFSHEDPGFTFKCPKQCSGKVFRISCEVIRLEPSIAKGME